MYAKQLFMVLFIYWGQKSKAIVNNATKSFILLSYTDVKDIDFPEAVIGFILKTRKSKPNKTVRKAVRRIYFNDCFW